jgi:RNA polymerase sigma-70 factor (ECF subfamily)
MGNATDAQDATQEALMAIVRGLPRFDGRSTFSTWSYRVATNACLDELRRRRRRPNPGLPDDDTGPQPTPQGAPGVADQIADRLSVDAALEQIPTEFRVAVILRDICALDYAEIADVLDIPPGTVRSRIARGRSLLADLIGNPGATAERQNPER